MLRYMKNIKEPLMHERNLHIIEVNKQSPYKQINITDKNQSQPHLKKDKNGKPI